MSRSRSVSLTISSRWRKFAAAKIEAEIAKTHKSRRSRDRARRRAAQDGGDPQGEFARLAGLAEIIVDPGFQTAHPVFRFAPRGQHQNRHVREFRGAGPQPRRERKTILARHHDIEDDQIEGKTFEAGHCFRGIGGGRDAIPFFAQQAGQQRPDAPVVIDNQKMRGVVGWRGQRRRTIR